MPRWDRSTDSSPRLDICSAGSVTSSRMKRTPTLSFELDDTSERAVRLTRLIDEETGA